MLTISSQVQEYQYSSIDYVTFGTRVLHDHSSVNFFPQVIATMLKLLLFHYSWNGGRAEAMCVFCQYSSTKNLLLKHVNWLFWRMIYYTPQF